MRDILWLFKLNIVIELLAAIVLAIVLGSVSGFWLPDFIDTTVFFTGLIVSGVLTFIFFYTPSVFLMNIRRFPRVPTKALVSIGMPLLIAALLWLIAPISTLEWGIIALVHFVSAVLIAAMVESVQASHSRAYPLRPVIKWVLILFALCTVVALHVIALPIFLGSVSGWMMWTLAFIWAVTLLELSLTKYYRSGVTYLAKKGYRPNAAVIVINER